MSHPELFDQPIPRETTRRLALESFEEMVKFVVDLERRVIAVGGGLHSDEEQMLLDHGSAQQNLWGANYYLDDTTDRRFEYTSMINIRPADGNAFQEIKSEELRKKVRALAEYFFESLK